MNLFFALTFGPSPFPMLGLSCFELICLRALITSMQVQFLGQEDPLEKE